MADTVRDLTDLLALLVVGGSGAIGAQDMRDILVSVHGVDGEIYTFDGSTAQTGIGVTPTLLTGFAADGLANGITPAHASDKLTVGTDGIYEVDSIISFSGTLNTLFTFEFAIDGVTASRGFERKIGSGGDTGTTGGKARLSMSAGEAVTLLVNADGASKSLTITYGTLAAKRIR